MSDRALCEIKNLGEFLEECLGKKVLDYKLKPLTKPGDSYGSVLRMIEVKFADESNKCETLQIVGKTPVIDAEYAEVFQPAESCIKENHFYSTIIPTLKHLQKISSVPKSERIDSFIRCYGARISLNPNAELADADALLLLENIKALNYVNGDRFVGFDSNETLAVIKQLARFHALCIAVRRLQPDVFQTNIKPYLKKISFIVKSDGTKLLDSTCDELRLLHDLDAEGRDNIQKQLKISFDFLREDMYHITTDTPYTTIIHRDLWLNNIMIKKDNTTGEPINVKIYDFQTFDYQSFVHDLIFFIFTSVRSSDLATDFQVFINCYHAEFVSALKLVNCPLDDYSFDKMWEEIQKKAKLEILHVLFMIKITTVDLSLLDEVSTGGFFFWKKLFKEAQDRWELTIQLFKENGFI